MHAVELVLHAIDLAPHLFELMGVHAGGGATHPPAGAVHDRHRHLQIAQQFRGWRPRRFRHLPLRLEKQLGFIENAFANHRRAVAPGGIQLPGLTRITVMLGERGGHRLAILHAEARHRHQVLHRHVRREFAFAHLPLDRFRQKFDERQTTRHPTHAAVEPARQLIQTVVETLFHLRRQPSLLQGGFVFGETQRAVQQQSVGLAHRPLHRFHGVPAQLLERRDALIAVDDQVSVGLAGDGHHHDGRLLSGVGQRSRQAPLPLGTAHSQMLPAPIELVKLQLHGLLSRRDSVWGRRQLVFRGGRGKCAGNSCGISHIDTKLVFRGAQQECAQNPNEISALASKLVFREVPGKLAQRRRQTQRLRRLLLCPTLLDSVGYAVLWVLRAPAGLRLHSPPRLALRPAACVLTAS